MPIAAQTSGEAPSQTAFIAVWVATAALGRRTLALARTGGRARDDGVDQRAADLAVAHFLAGNVELQQAHAALDVHADGAGVDVRGRDQHAAHRRAVADVRVGVQDKIGDAGRTARVQRLLQAAGVEAVADRARADHGDGLALVVRRGQDAGCLAGLDDLRRHVQLPSTAPRFGRAFSGLYPTNLSVTNRAASFIWAVVRPDFSA
jgi:hypothetical protein